MSNNQALTGKWHIYLKSFLIFSAIFIVIFAGSLIVSAAGTPTTDSKYTIGGVKAYGSTGFHTSVAYADTTHAATSAKVVGARGTYMKNNIGYNTAYTYVYSYSSNSASASVPLPSGATAFVGSAGIHSVNLGGTSWSDTTVSGYQAP